MIKKLHFHRRTRAALAAREKYISPVSVDLDQVQAELFGTPSVTRADIDAWLISIAQLDPDSPRAAQYVAGYDVAGKIARAKADGTFYAMIQAANHYRE